ncbi:helix-turn-helix domain-containing protein [Pseudochryseolinea flava]|uniref:AraC family transcriptional regulator n=1 Tax=Pseudochryseolinea flava TaxID=2059302 RepID=A0A364Y7P7_9BACT|nr:helix-turn-helix domain-containing protein [Pseudochryseolinea flava]RAW02154.1 AraC family transcriptional regulator [Pseudochryseolinea flava]
MSDSPSSDSQFIAQLKTIIQSNIANDSFGVSELSDIMNMSRSNLLRKVKKETSLSVSQFISQVRLRKAHEILLQSPLNVSEVATQVGFNSPSYFIKCFREYYGYPPGEVSQHANEQPQPNTLQKQKRNLPLLVKAIGATILLISSTAGYLYFFPVKSFPQEKSIVVLPFKNESTDSANTYLVNGLMESTLNKLQLINELNVLSRTTAEKYRNTLMSIPEMAAALNAQYFIEGSGQKIGDRIVLNIQLIEGSTDKNLWAKQYRREAKDIFQLQQEIAKDIADEIEVVISPEAAESMDKVPTRDLAAYDLYLKGRELFHHSGTRNLNDAIPYFTKAIEKDNEFSLAYANLVMIYYYLDLFAFEKKYSSQISQFADKAMLYDAKSAESLIAKALSFAVEKDFKSATLFFERALTYNKNHTLAIHFLTEFHSLHVHNARKYLKYAILGATIDIHALDSIATSTKYFHLANGLLQNGFIDDAQRYMEASLAFDPNNFFACYVNAYVRFAQTHDFKDAQALLKQEVKKKPMRFDIIQELAKVTFYLHDYKEAYTHYEKFLQLSTLFKMEVFQSEELKIAFTLNKLGRHDEAIPHLKNYKAFAEKDQSMYRSLYLAAYHAYQHENKAALDYLKQFATEDSYPYWILFLDNDPIFENVKHLPAFKDIMNTVRHKFQDTHDEWAFIFDRSPLPVISTDAPR